MKAIWIFLFLAVFSFGSAARTDVEAPKKATMDMAKAEEVFARQVHPYLRQTCAKCHSEQATYPHGPDHSLKDPKAAFTVFSRYINWTDIGKSSVIKMVNNQHFCTEFNEYCDTGMKIAADVNKLLQDYAKSVTTSSMNTIRQEDDDIEITYTAETEIGSPTTIRVFTEEQTFAAPESSQSTMSFDLSHARKKDQSLTLLLNFTHLKENFYRVDSVYMAGSPGAVRVQDMRILVNGMLPSKRTGFERINRNVLFNTKFFNVKRVLLAPTKPILQINAGDQISLGFKRLRHNDQPYVPFCSSDIKAVALNNDFIDDLFRHMNDQLDGEKSSYSFLNEYNESYPEEVVENRNYLRDLCLEIESRLDRKNLRRSVMFFPGGVDTYKNRNGFVQYSSQAYNIQEFVNLLEKAELKDRQYR